MATPNELASLLESALIVLDANVGGWKLVRDSLTDTETQGCDSAILCNQMMADHIRRVLDSYFSEA